MGVGKMDSASHNRNTVIPTSPQVVASLRLSLPSCGVATEHSAGREINKSAPFPLILHPSILPSPPRSLVLIRHVHIRRRGDAFMIIHPPSPPLIMAALDAHPLCTRHLALTLLGLTVCITTLFNGLFRGAEGAGGWGQGRAGNFPRVSSRGSSKEPLGRSGVRVIDGTMLKWRAEGAGSGGPLPITECPLCLATLLG